MKLYLTAMLILTGITLGNAQDFTYGLKAGTNFTSGGQIRGISHKDEDTKEYVYFTGTSQAQSQTGYHGGGFLEMDFGDFFLRPEIIYTTLKTEFSFPAKNSVLTVKKLDLPLLLGYNFNKFAGLYAGPVYSPLFNSSLEDKQASNSGKDEVWNDKLNSPDLPVNLQLGLKSQLLGIGIDLRYEYNLSSSQPEEINMINSIGETIEGHVNKATLEDSNFNQLILSLSYDLSNLKNPNITGRKYSYSRRRRAR
ncbi:MAG TPA: PorT family protein [Salinimicrobium catena]|uniref:PorT family protein n=1 Tax=Salinimicrobium catena TaxID=390640 RepID=A0A7C2RDI0_9FLAO|nr:PorT family protein [Salinimicrobium catena]